MLLRLMPKLSGHGVKDLLAIAKYGAGFFSGDTRLEDQGGRGYPSVFDNKHLKRLVEQPPRQILREMPQIMRGSISTISEPVQKRWQCGLHLANVLEIVEMLTPSK